MLPPMAAPAFVSPREQGGWQGARAAGRETTLRGPVAHHHMHAKGLGKGGSGEFGGPGWRMAEISGLDELQGPAHHFRAKQLS